MSEWAAKRFWTDVDLVEGDAGWEVTLDGRVLKTPGKVTLVLPTRALADQVAEEWRAVDGLIDPGAMPWTRSANSAIEKVVAQRAEVEDHLAGYAMTDLVCYRADGPQSLVERQAAVWDPLIDWVSDAYGVTFSVTSGVMPISQPDELRSRLVSVMADMNSFELTGFHDLVTLSGSYVIALCAVAERDSREALWSASRVDEDFQSEQWGVDEEAAEEATLRKLAFFHAWDFFRSAKKTGSVNELRR